MLQTCVRYISSAVVFWGLLFYSANFSIANETVYFESLKTRLIKDGYPSSRIKILYQNPKTLFSPKTLSVFFRHREANLDYDQYTTQVSLKNAAAYIQKHYSALKQAEKQFGVDYTIITAIILVETQFGRLMGTASVFNCLSSMAALADDSERQALWEIVNAQGETTRDNFDAWCSKKSAWAYDELKALLTYTHREKLNPLKIKGSYAGAFGIPQFIPSSILKYAVDGNKDGKINLFQHTDSIYSIASYLKHYGWHPGINLEKAREVLWEYNHSSYYINSLLTISQKLKGLK